MIVNIKYLNDLDCKVIIDEDNFIYLPLVYGEII